MIDLIKKLYLLERDIISDGYDEALSIISEIIPLKIHQYPTGMPCWTWTMPEKWSCGEAWIEDLEGNRLIDIANNPLHVVRYSLPIDRIISRKELLPHIYTNPQRPGAIPYRFKYYERDAGFCLEHNRLGELSSPEYRIKINSTFEDGFLKVGECEIQGKTDDIIVICTHLCHPCQANDDLSGVAVAAHLAEALAKVPHRYTYKIFFVPETIGSIAYLSQNEDLIPKMKYGIFLEMLGNNNDFSLQFSRQATTHLDKIACLILEKNTIPYLLDRGFKMGEFRKIICNDEMVWNGPGIDIPMISLSRWPYPEYHTSDDTPEIISKERLDEAYKIILKILDILDHDYYPKRTFKGPAFLSGYGLWVDWQTNKELNENIEQIMLRMEGNKSVFDISQELAINFQDARNYIDKFYEKGLIEKL